MAERKFTEEQTSAIVTRDKTLLVSAAAGSGKTATLIERIIRSLLREDGPEDISRILIVTFTNAATNEIKERISAALTRALNENPDNKRLERQLTLLPMARIHTIDGFCNDILKRNADKVGIPPNYRIAETAEVAILSYSLLEGLIAAIYEGLLPELATAEEFSRLSDTLTSSKGTGKLEDSLLWLYEKTKSLPQGVNIFKSFAEERLSTDPCNNKYIDYALKALNQLGEYYASALSSMLRTMPEMNIDKLSALIRSDIAMAEEFATVKSYKEANELLRHTAFGRMPTVKEKSAELNSYKDLRNEFKEDLARLSERLFSYSPEEWRELTSGLGEMIGLLADVLAKFDEIYSLEKKKRAMLEYSDIEKYTYQALYENGEVSELARSLANEFSTVYIDEYQDVNALQNKIFEAISRENNRFMVGDIKQSIYGFRSAEPDIFAEMKKSFPALSASDTSPAASIFMSKNFRSDAYIIDFINGIFDTVFELVGESIGYKPEDKLTAGKLHDTEPTLRAPEFILVSTPKEDGTDTVDDEELEYTDSETNSAANRRRKCEIVAERIEALLKSGRLNNGKLPTPSDIAIILRGGKERMSDYAEALEARGIPAMKTDNRDFFLNSEILLALSLLNAIDNPERDIYLAGLMASPLFSFTPDELFLIRREGTGSLYGSIVSYCDMHPEFTKGRHLLDKLSFYRTLSEGMNIDSFMLRLFNDTGILTLARKDGGEENLLMLYDYAKRFSSSKFKGLYNFIKFINNIIARETQFDAKREENAGDAVVITTVHSSKGLEYPIVFYVDTDTRLENKDLKERVVFSGKYGISMRLRSPGGLALVENPIHNVICDIERKRYFEEELRVIYVALTRAREELYIVGAIGSDAEKYLLESERRRETLAEYSLYKLSSPLKLMLATHKIGKRTLYINNTPETEEDTEEQAFDALDNSTDAITANEDTFALPQLAELGDRLSFKYPYRHMTELPEKISISKLNPTVLDGSEDEPAELSIDKIPRKKSEKRDILPEFIVGTASDESARRGIATHTFLQFCDIEAICKTDEKEELERLRRAGFISDDDAKRVRLGEIALFKRSGLFREMQEAKRIYRELRFTTELPAKYFTRDAERRDALRDEMILTQGVIDCLIEEADGTLRLVDYKTDRLTKEELGDRELARATLTRKHALQLRYYSLAIKEIFGREPRDLRVYSLPLGDCIDIEKTKIE